MSEKTKTKKTKKEETTPKEVKEGSKLVGVHPITGEKVYK